MSSCREANQFFRSYLNRGAIGSTGSWVTISRALYDYFSFLEAHELSWRDVDRGERKDLVAAYRDYCFNTAELARSTVRNRLVYICAFYEYVLQKHWVSRVPYEMEIRHISASPRYLAHVDASGGKRDVRSVMPIKHKDLPKFLTKDHALDLLRAATNPHHRMIIRTALLTGLRREELASLPLAYVLNAPSATRGERNLRLTLDPGDGTGMKTKGSRKRQIVLSYNLMNDLQHYAKHYRGERASMSKVAAATAGPARVGARARRGDQWGPW